ncbi:hypothetical protein CQW23_04247 [Capsicum baccatum]|uniref:Retrovirus-related Pol polyprotein from transposon TNT 1-94 n=1 Tax=Capsicum baccatum TaxID=33114 RepID=A0A2G2XEJ4_CAPBA|nr:hypothetical protein CQW23_04247 [Capsicum baccatum]
MESEFIALDKAGKEEEWLWNFLQDIPYSPKLVAPVCMYCDSQAAIGRAGSMMYNSKSRHIRRRHNTIRELLSSGIITIDYVKSKDNVSDPLTKGLSREGVERTSKGMGLRPRTSQHGEDCLPHNDTLHSILMEYLWRRNLEDQPKKSNTEHICVGLETHLKNKLPIPKNMYEYQDLSYMKSILKLHLQAID